MAVADRTATAKFYWRGFSDILLTAAFSAFFVTSAAMRVSAWAKLGSGKIHASEERTGIVFLCRYAFLIGYAIFGCLDQILTGADYSNNREDSKGYGNITSVVVAERSGKTGYNVIRHVTTAATARGLLTRLFDLYAKNYGVYYLYDRYRSIFA